LTYERKRLVIGWIIFILVDFLKNRNIRNDVAHLDFKSRKHVSSLPYLSMWLIEEN